ncbi:helix-turn-helix domain-containing protein [Bacillus norwichensis]|uniref:Helix-turn-helix domain-containing protein n=1 Tax=Bacillus norwichensis TaxID=2762217 RepID=A0ABR8VFB9_9BACI|nr:helix-turn-helix domain-containing protein [Bacillus norwichensis]MBD8003478.1 helix-turn-helix domain-containing protein [Bacillus norwichensis]
MIGQRIKDYRLQKKLSLSELADRADIAKSYLSSIERNIQSNPSIQILEKLSSVLDVPVQVLLHGETGKIELDHDWEELVHEAMSSGITKEEFREFLEFNKWKMKNK